jgi:hypothetical protein
VTTKRFPLIPGLVIAAVLAVAGCGGQPFPQSQSQARTNVSGGAKPPTTPQARLLAAVTSTTESGTARFALDMSMSGLGTTGTMTITGTGAMDLGRRRLAMTMRGDVVGQSVDLEMRVVGGTLYLKKGGSWTSMTPTASGFSTPNPSSYLDYLQGIASNVHVEGRETLRGVATTRYTATADLDRAWKRIASGAKRAAISNALHQFGLTKIPVTVWVDDAGRLRKLKMSMDLGALAKLPGAPAGFDPKIVMTMELYDFGVPVDVQIPAGALPVTGTSSNPTFCLAEVCAPSGPSARDIQIDLRNALTAEKVQYVDTQEYTADVATLRSIEPSLDWGGKLKVVVGDVPGSPRTVLCLSETSGGQVYSVGDVASGLRVDTRFGNSPCPDVVDAAYVSTLDRSW